MKLTQNQITGLLEVESGNVVQRNYGGHAWGIECHTIHPVVIGRLEKMGLIEWRLESDGNYTAYLTDSGKQALTACS